jgi:hypothetical protein
MYAVCRVVCVSCRVVCRVSCAVVLMVKRFAQMCTLELNSVCGCNDQTYSNPCLAFSSGVSIRSFGECQGVCRVSCVVCRVS